MEPKAQKSLVAYLFKVVKLKKSEICVPVMNQCESMCLSQPKLYTEPSLQVTNSLVHMNAVYVTLYLPNLMYHSMKKIHMGTDLKQL